MRSGGVNRVMADHRGSQGMRPSQDRGIAAILSPRNLVVYAKLTNRSPVPRDLPRDLPRVLRSLGGGLPPVAYRRRWSCRCSGTITHKSPSPARCGRRCGWARPSSPSPPLHPAIVIQNYSVMSKIIHLTSGELTLQINKGAMQHWVGQPRLSGEAWAE